MIHSKLLAEDMKMALDNIRVHKVRSFLTIFGVMIGVTVAITASSFVLGFQSDVQQRLNEFGVNNLFIFKFEPGFHGRLTPEERTRKSLTFEDGMAIKEQVPAVKNVSIEVFPRVAQDAPRVIYTARYKGHELSSINYVGITTSYVEVQGAKMQDGRFFTDLEDLHREDVVVIGYDVAQKLFPGESPVDKSLEVSGTTYRVIGILEKKKNTNIGSGDNEVLVPYRTYRKHHPQDDEHFITAMVSPGLKSVAEDEVRGLLRIRRHVPYDKPDNFGISSAEQAGNQVRQILSGVLLLVVAIVSIGLLVGGVGVMNIMLMGVTERTREIGVRKAIGARKRDISFQFLTEAMTLTGTGGVIGVALSLGISSLLRLAHFPSSIPISVIILGVGVASSVGLFFGIYPAMKAARLDPVDALRYE